MKAIKMRLAEIPVKHVFEEKASRHYNLINWLFAFDKKMKS